MRIILLLLLMSSGLSLVQAQDKVIHPRPITMEEYEKARHFTVKDLDNDTYVKFDNAYILDRYEMRKPYFITGDDGLKKRIDLYKLIAKDSLQELGLVIFYTNEKGKQYEACLPNFTAGPKVWAQYFEDIHHIDKEEKNFVLKLSYVLSREMGFQLYKAINNGRDMKEESATYGNDICFPGDQEVVMADGRKKQMQDIQPGDRIVTVDPQTRQANTVQVKALVSHPAKNYALTRLLLVAATETDQAKGHVVRLTGKVLEATPNHPLWTENGKCPAGSVQEGDHITCFDEASGSYRSFIVLNKKEYTRGPRKVYNIEASGGETFMVNDVMVMQK